MLAPLPLTSEEIIFNLKELTQGLSYRSEGDYPFETLHFELTSPNQLTKEEVLTLIGHYPDEPIEVSGIAFFFRNVTKSSNEIAEVANTIKQVSTLQTFLEQHLQEVKVYRIGKRTINAYIIGKIPEGGIIGLKTTVIET